MNKYIKGGILLGTLPIAVIFYLLDPGQYILFPPCIFYSTTGLFCPGCGSQRAIHSLMHFNIANGAGKNFLILPALFAIVYHYIHPAVNKRFHMELPNVFYQRNTPWFIFGIVFLFWILRNLNFFPFSMLAPH